MGANLLVRAEETVAVIFRSSHSYWSIHCSGVMDSWNSLAMLSSSVSAAVGDNAWSQDWAKLLAFEATS